RARGAVFGGGIDAFFPLDEEGYAGLAACCWPEWMGASGASAGLEAPPPPFQFRWFDTRAISATLPPIKGGRGSALPGRVDLFLADRGDADFDAAVERTSFLGAVVGARILLAITDGGDAGA